jgi:hypothetical protein
MKTPSDSDRLAVIQTTKVSPIAANQGAEPCSHASPGARLATFADHQKWCECISTSLNYPSPPPFGPASPLATLNTPCIFLFFSANTVRFQIDALDARLARRLRIAVSTGIRQPPSSAPQPTLISDFNLKPSPSPRRRVFENSPEALPRDRYLQKPDVDDWHTPIPLRALRTTNTHLRREGASPFSPATPTPHSSRQTP